MEARRSQQRRSAARRASVWSSVSRQTDGTSTVTQPAPPADENWSKSVRLNLYNDDSYVEELARTSSDEAIPGAIDTEVIQVVDKIAQAVEDDTPDDDVPMPSPFKTKQKRLKKENSIANMARLKRQETDTDASEFTTSSATSRFERLRRLHDRTARQTTVEDEDGDKEAETASLDSVMLVENTMVHLDKRLEKSLDNIPSGPSFSAYAADHFNWKHKMMFGRSRAIPHEVLVSYQPNSIRAPLHRFDKKETPTFAKNSTAAFKALLGFMKSKGGERAFSSMKVWFKFGYESHPLARNELLTQLIKQTTKCENRLPMQRAMEIFVLTAGCFTARDVPQGIGSKGYRGIRAESLNGQVLRHLADVAESGQVSEIRDLARYAIVRFKKTLEVGPRHGIPEFAELEWVRTYDPIMVNVLILDGSSVDVQVDSWTTASSLCQTVSDMLQVRQSSYFGIYQERGDDMQRFVGKREHILDTLASWKQNHAVDEDNAIQLVYKLRLFFDLWEDDKRAVKLAYHQVVNDVTDDRYPCTEDDAFTLAALQAQERFGDYNPKIDVFGDELEAFLPSNYYDKEVEAELKEMIVTKYEILKGYKAEEMRNNYLDYVQAWPLYGSAYFWVEPVLSSESYAQWTSEREVLLAVNLSGVMIYHPRPIATSERVLATYPFSELISWGASHRALVLVVGNDSFSKKHHYKTETGDEIVALISDYAKVFAETEAN